VRQFRIQALVLLAVVAIAGCAARGKAASLNAAKTKTADSSKAAEAGSLQEYIAKVRHLSAVARPAATTTSATTLESRIPELAEALLQVQAAPTADAYLAAGKLYRQRGVLDAAYRHYNAALKLQPDSAEAYEGLARVWRDWRLPELAVGDAARARFYAPDSPEIENTFGTIMQALGRNGDARRAYERAKRLDARATYALNNLCYLAFLEGRMEAAVDLCRAAVKLDPGLKTAHHNLALAYAASGEMALANAAFADASDAAEASFNLGIVYMAGRNYRDAAAAFDAASRARPTLNIARERASEARSLARTAPQPVPSTPDVGDTK
jgi:Flp pilus assembly protein TadD